MVAPLFFCAARRLHHRMHGYYRGCVRTAIAGKSPVSSSSHKQTVLICHGAWWDRWAGKKMRPRMQAAGHQLLTPTYTGLGAREHLASPSIDLETHIQDV